MLKTGWMKMALAAAGLLLVVSAVACSGGDDEDVEPTGSTGATPAAGGEATATPGDQGAPINTPDGSSGAPGSGGTGSAPPMPDFEEPPVTTATANGETVETGIGTYCWTTMCVDKIGVPTKGSLTVSRGDIVTIEIPEDAPALREAGANVFEATEPQRLDDGSEIWPYPGAPGAEVASEVAGDTVEVVIDLEPGRYVLSVGMYFEAGDVIYGVLVDVQ